MRRGVPAVLTVGGVALVALDFLLLRSHAGGFVPGSTTRVGIAVALGAFAIAVAFTVALRHRAAASTHVGRLAAALAAIAVLLPSYGAARAIALAGWQDSGTPGRRPAHQTALLSSYLRRHQLGARYEVATHAVGSVSALIVRDARPVLFLSNLGRQPLVSLPRFISLVPAGGGRRRSALVHVPPGSAAGQRLPIVLALHGSRANGAFMAGYTGLSLVADGQDFVAVYPDAAAGGWNQGSTDASRPDDVRFTSDLLDAV